MMMKLMKIARPQLSLLVAIARIELPKPWTNLPESLLNTLLTCLNQLESNATSSKTATVLLNTIWVINALVREWRSVKLTAGAAVMVSLGEMFYGPCQRLLSLWGQSEQNGQDDYVIQEAGRYAFKWVVIATCAESESSLASDRGTGAKRRIFKAPRLFRM